MTYRTLLPEAMLIVASVFAASGWVFSLYAIHGLPPLFFLGLRFLVAGLLIGGIGGFRSCHLSDLRASLPGSVMLALSMMLWITGLKHASNPGVASFISACGNLIMPVFGFLLYRWPIGRRVWYGLALALVGMGFLFLDGGATVEASNLYFAVAACFWGLSMVVSRRGTGSGVSVITLTALQLLLSGAIMLACSALLERWPSAFPSGEVMAAFAGGVLLATCGRFLLQYKGQHMISAGRASVVMTLEPVWTLILSLTVLGTSVSPSQAIGCAVIFSALLFTILPPRGLSGQAS